MKKVFDDCSVGKIISFIRSREKLGIKEVGIAMNKSDVWVSNIEHEKNRIYMYDFIELLKIFNYDAYLINNDDRKIRIRDYEPKEILRILKELSGLNVPEFADIIGKKKTWLVDNQAGKINYYANDLFLLAYRNGFQVELRFGGEKNED